MGVGEREVRSSSLLRRLEVEKRACCLCEDKPEFPRDSVEHTVEEFFSR